MANTLGRQIQDYNLIASHVLPTAASTVQTAAFDLGDEGYKPEHVELEVSVPATPSLASAATVAALLTFTVLADSAATPTTALPLTFAVAGTAAGSGAATTKNLRLPSDCARYLAVKVAAGANAGDNSAVSFTAKLLF
jgi:hypothetical protein